MQFNCAYTELVELHRLIPNPKNANKHPEEQIEHLAKVMDYQGQRAPIVVSLRSGFIVKGHGRLEAMKKLGWPKAAVDFQQYESEAQEYADMIADNEIARYSELNIQMFKAEMENFKDLDIDFFGIKDFEKINLPEPEIEIFDGKLDHEGEWEGMPTYDTEDKNSLRHVIVHFKEEEDAEAFFRTIGQQDTGKTKSIWFPPQVKMDTESKRYGEGENITDVDLGEADDSETQS